MKKGSRSKHRRQNHHSTGVSKEITTNVYETCREEIAEIEIASIQSCPIIPDYKEPTRLNLPVVVKTPEMICCIDGWHFIDNAKNDGQLTIRCHIYYITHHSNTELAIRKVAHRTVPAGGKCSYSELIRNTRHLYRTLMSTSDDLILFSHGGDRRSIEFTNSRDNNVRALLAYRLEKSQTTINKYLQHSEGLNDEVMHELTGKAVAKHLFEAFQSTKQAELTVLKADQTSQNIINEKISNLMMDWLVQYQRQLLSPIPPAAPSQRLKQDTNPPHEESSSSSELETSPPREHPIEVEISESHSVVPNLDEVTGELRAISEALIQVAESQTQSPTQRAQILKELITRLARIVQFAAQMPSEGTDGKGGQS